MYCVSMVQPLMNEGLVGELTKSLANPIQCCDKSFPQVNTHPISGSKLSTLS